MATAAEAQRQTREFAQAVGIEDLAIESFLGLPLDALRTGKPLGWAVSIDARTVQATSMVSLATGDLSDVPLLVGSTLHDGTLNILPTILNTRTFGDLHIALAGSLNGQPDEFREVALHYRDLLPDRSTADLLMLGVSYGRFRYPFTKLLDAWGRHNRAPVYRYQFNWRSPAAGGLIGSCHGADIPFWFGHLNSRIVGKRPPQGLATAMATALGAFARCGTPACPQLPDWPEYDARHRSTMVLDAEPHVAGQELYQEQAIWEEFAGPRASDVEPYRNSWRLYG
jgi:carboxylesterase type B